MHNQSTQLYVTTKHIDYNKRQCALGHAFFGVEIEGKKPSKLRVNSV